MDGILSLFAAMKPTIGVSHDIALTATASYFELDPGMWLLTNIGPHPCNIRMHKSTAYVATTSDMPLFPVGSGDRSYINVMVGMKDVKEPTGVPALGTPRYLHGICSAGLTATIRATLVTLR